MKEPNVWSPSAINKRWAEHRKIRKAEQRAKDKLALDNFGVLYDQLPEERQMFVELAYARDQRDQKPTKF